MFDNVGGKIKSWAVVMCVLGFCASIIAGIVYLGEAPDKLKILGLVYAALGCLGSWVSSTLTYGFGELIERTKRIDEKMDAISSSKTCAPIDTPPTNSTTNVSENEKPMEVSPHKWRCINCNRIIYENKCPYCGHEH